MSDKVVDTSQDAWTARMLMERVMMTHDAESHTLVEGQVDEDGVRLKCSCGVSIFVEDAVLRRAGVSRKRAREALRNVPGIGKSKFVRVK